MATLADAHTALTNHPAITYVEEHQDICHNIQAHSYIYTNNDTVDFDLWVEEYLPDELLIVARQGDDMEGAESLKLHNHPNDNHMQLVMRTISDLCKI